MLKKGWKVSDDIDLSFNPRGGEIVGLSDKEWKKLIVNAQGFWTGKTTEGKVASVTFWTGLRAVPVWTSREAADQKISEHWPTDSVFEIIDRNEFVHKIKKNKIQWVAINFNCNECDTVACI